MNESENVEIFLKRSTNNRTWRLLVYAEESNCRYCLATLQSASMNMFDQSGNTHDKAKCSEVLKSGAAVSGPIGTQCAL